MRDLITYAPDVNLLLAEVETAMPDYLIKDESGNAAGFKIDKTPTFRKGSETLSVVRCSAKEVILMESLTSVRILANVAAYGDLLAAMATADRAIYDSVHDQTPQTYTLEDGTKATYTPPALIGGFA